MDQCTGLKDRNGVEIYEGDIVRQDLPCDPDENLFSVEWTHGGFYLNNRINSAAPEKFQDLNFTVNPVEVIGNIYDDPNLLAPEAKQ